MKSIKLQDLKAKLFFSKPLFLDECYVLLTPECPVDEQLIKRLSHWEFRETYSDGQALDAATGEKGAAAIEVVAQKESADSQSVSIEAGDKERLALILDFYAKFTEYVEALYTRFVTTTELDYTNLISRVRKLYELCVENRRHLLMTSSTMPTSDNYLVSHSVRSATYSIIIGMTLKLPPFRVIELGAAAVLHEIGMTRMPPRLYMADRPLNPQERISITAHPILGYKLLKDKQVPLAVCLAALEHHERLNGSGYPRSITKDKISLYSRIIMVACSFDAVTASRPFREAKDGYSGMVDILKNEGKQYDDAVIKALVYSLSIYPIGTQVMLTSGKPAVVVDVNPENPRYPVVKVLGARSPDGKELVLRTGETSVRILRPLRAEEKQADVDLQ